MFVGFIRVCFVHSGEPRGSSGSFGFVCFTRARQHVLRIHSLLLVNSGAIQGSSCSFGRAANVVGVLLIFPDAHRGSSISFWFIRARPGVRKVHSRSFCLFDRAPGVIDFIRVRLVHSCAPRGSSASFTFVWFIHAHTGGHWVHSRSFS